MTIYNLTPSDKITMQNNVNVTFEEKQGNKYVQTWASNDEAQIYNDLAHELISKKINQCTWIKSIKRTQLYNGYQKIVVYYDHGGRRVYTITDH